jgi:predicted ATPase/DNA-binding winged helix-turn-helix (wHTH) protein
LDHYVFVFDRYTLDPQRRSLMRGGSEVVLGSRALDLLIALVENVDDVLSRDYLVSRVWPTTVVEDSSLRVHVAALRRALEDGHEERRRIVNVLGRGYSFIGPVSKALRQGTAAAPPRPATAVESALAPLVGRDHTIAATEAMLDSSRVITIVGPGGIGKSSLALHLLARRAHVVADRAFRVDLSDVGSRHPAEQVAGVLGVPPSDLMSALQRAPSVLLLDNCELVLEEVAAFVGQVSLHSPHAQLVCTCLEPLNVVGERVIRLEPLANSPQSISTLKEALRFPAIGLLVERARAAADSVAFDDADVPRLRALCELLDGVPLAIELAAVRIESVGLNGLTERPGDLLNVLTRGRRSAPPRHRSLRAVIDRSYELLDADERRVFCGLSVFDVSFSLTSAVAVVGPPFGPAAIEEIVLTLVDKSMVVSCPEAGREEDGTCFRLPGMLRHYGRERLAGMADVAHVHERYAEEVRQPVRSGLPDQAPSATASSSA